MLSLLLMFEDDEDTLVFVSLCFKISQTLGLRRLN